MLVVAPPFGFARSGREWLPVTLVGEGLQVVFDLPITGGNLAVIELVQLHGLLQGKQVLRPPIALQGAGDVRFVMLAAAVA